MLCRTDGLLCPPSAVSSSSGTGDAWLNPPGLSEQELQKRTLTNLYNARPDWLDAAHKRLDAAVFDAYGWPHDLSDDEILARLLALNLTRAGVQASSGCGTGS